jgi:hypothetical protein
MDAREARWLHGRAFCLTRFQTFATAVSAALFTLVITGMAPALAASKGDGAGPILDSRRIGG